MTMRSRPWLLCALIAVLAATLYFRALDEIPAIRDALLHGMARRIHELDQRV